MLDENLQTERTHVTYKHLAERTGCLQRLSTIRTFGQLLNKKNLSFYLTVHLALLRFKPFGQMG